MAVTTTNAPDNDLQKQVEIQTSADTTIPLYTNLAFVTQNKREFVFNFCYQEHGQLRLVARLATSPGHAKALSKILQGLLETFEKQHGEIEPQGAKGEAKRRKGVSRSKKSSKKKTRE